MLPAVRRENVHIGDLNFGVFAFPSHLADNYPVGTSAALAFKIRGERVAVACTGDGGTSRGDFHGDEFRRC